jgi:hypothetical protein
MSGEELLLPPREEEGAAGILSLSDEAASVLSLAKDEEEKEEKVGILSLPDEVLIKIIRYLGSRTYPKNYSRRNTGNQISIEMMCVCSRKYVLGR